MDKEKYLDMCEQLGSTPIEEEIPPSFEDFPLEVVQAWNIYSCLPQKWDGFSGTYYGRSLEYINEIFSILDIHTDRLEIFKVVAIIDSIEREDINSRQKNTTPQK